VVSFARYGGKWLLCKHRDRDTWETSGGHIEPGEAPLDAARRELYEETGALDFDITPVCDYWACDEPHEREDITWANGQVFLAELKKTGPLPESEMERVELFDDFPGNLTYPDITAALLPEVLGMVPGGGEKAGPPDFGLKEKNERLVSQLRFIVEIDRVNNIFRKSRLFDGGRFENDAEHSWTICMMALLMGEYANVPVNMERVMGMLLIHDIVEIDAGDTFLYAAERAAARENEARAAERIFGLLEGDQREYLMELWREFEERKTGDAKYAAAFDRLEPLLQNYYLEGYTWKKYGVTHEMALEKNGVIKDGSAELWDFARGLLKKAVEKGYLAG
jgi:putative hydrolase of HD superfamily